MKIFISLVVCAFILQAEGQNKNMPAKAGKKFRLKGKIHGSTTQWLYLGYSNADGKWVRDSAMIKTGSFEFIGAIKEPSAAILGFDKSGSLDGDNSVSLFLEPTVMTLQLKMNDFKNAKMEGSKSQKQAEQLEKSKASVYKQLEPLYKEYNAINQKFIAARKANAPESSLDSMKETMEEIRNRMEPYRDQLTQKNLAFFRKNPNSYVTAFNLRFYVSSLSLDSLEWFYDNMDEAIQKSSYGTELNKEIIQLRGGSPGSIAKDFAATDIEGKPLRLSDFKGKYVLLDFWASWCVPCRKGNPHLKELYKKYKEAGIEFIGVSDDDNNPDAWRKAVAKDELPWKHVLRGLDMQKIRKGEENPADINDKFGIQVLPTKILIDKEGKIIGRFNEEEVPLDKLLHEIFGK